MALVRWPVFSRTSYQMLASLRDQGLTPRTVVDVGANRGQFTVAARNLLKPARIHSFEPLPEAAAALERACERYREVSTYRVALGAEEGRATLHVNAHSQSSSLLSLGDRHLRAFPGAREVADVEVAVQVPSNAAPGQHTIRAVAANGTCAATATITITGAGAAAGARSSDQLAFTAGWVLALVAVALVSLTVGAALMIGSSRRAEVRRQFS